MRRFIKGVVSLPDGDLGLTPGSMLRWLYELDVEEVAGSRYKAELTRFQERERAAVETDGLFRSEPRDVEEILYEKFNGVAIERAIIDATGDVPGSSGSVPARVILALIFNQSIPS